MDEGGKVDQRKLRRRCKSASRLRKRNSHGAEKKEEVPRRRCENIITCGCGVQRPHEIVSMTKEGKGGAAETETISGSLRARDSRKGMTTPSHTSRSPSRGGEELGVWDTPPAKRSNDT